MAKYKRSYCDKYVFIDKEINLKYLLYKDENKKEMNVKELEINQIWENADKNENEKENDFFYYLYKIEDKLFIITEIPEKNKEQ